MLMVSHASHQHQRIAQALSTLEQPLDIVFEESNSGPLGALVIDGMGNAILDPISASAHESKSVVIRPCEPAIRFDLWVIYPAKQPRTLSWNWSQIPSNLIKRRANFQRF